MSPDMSKSTKSVVPVWQKIAFYFGVILSVVFLIVSIVSWNLLLGICAALLAIGLSRLTHLIGIEQR